jgi:hypothetical protein
MRGRAFAVVDVHTHLDDLVNLELLRKGAYRVDVSVACGVAGLPQTCYAAPARLTSLARQTEVAGSDATEPGGIEGASYLSRQVACRFNDEAFDLNEGATFRLRLPLSFGRGGVEALRCEPGASRIAVTIRLLRAELSPGVAGGEQPPVVAKADAAAFAEVARRVVHVRNPLLAFGDPLASVVGGAAPGSTVKAGGHGHGEPAVPQSPSLTASFIPVLFDATYLLSVGLVVHACHVSTAFELDEAAEGDGEGMHAPGGGSGVAADGNRVSPATPAGETRLHLPAVARLRTAMPGVAAGTCGPSRRRRGEEEER